MPGLHREVNHLLDVLHHHPVVLHNVLADVPIVVLLARLAVHVIVPVADKDLLVEQRPVGTEEGESLAGQVRVCTHAEHLTSRLQVRIVACGAREREREEDERGNKRVSACRGY